ncbi:ATP-binding protein [Thalassospira sp. MCCC 1A01428]|uniref:sensor histidine kinase n=1 Tax=Thalassospira sp. MCCC 1A01428 TaxID=1470575 RepID=UPI001FED75E1|nr:ATP-binding protein [Thalassospira sp. MCCC 1A01428]
MLKTSQSVRRSARLVLVGMLLLLPVTIFISMQGWRETRIVTLEEEGRNKLELYRSNLQGAIKEHEYLPITLASDRRILTLAGMHHPTAEDTNEVNRYLEKLAADSGASDIYFMDNTGETIAASNWNSNASFVGRNFGFRPYFKQAMGGNTGHYFAFGITSNVPGYYISHPVLTNGRDIAGVMVVKTHLETLVNRWARGGESVLVEDENGIVIISSHPEWRFRDLRGLSEGQRRNVLKSRKYGEYPLTAMPVTKGNWPRDGVMSTLELASIATETPIEHDTTISDDRPNDVNTTNITPDPAGNNAVTNTDDGLNRTSAPFGKSVAGFPAPRPDDSQSASSRTPATTRYLTIGSTLPRQGWRIFLLTDKAVLDQSILAAAFIAGAIHIIIMGTIFMLLQRRRAMLEQLEIRDWSQRELEHQVKLRTADLMNTNVRLAEEITERQRTEDALRTAQAELVQAGKLAALGQMSAGIAHEINQPLTAIRSYADNARQFFARGQTEPVERNLTRISELTERMGRITNHLKTFARRPEYDSGPVDVAHAIQKAIDLVRETGRVSNAVIAFPRPKQGMFVTAEETQLEQVFINLLTNAADASRDQDDARIMIDITRGSDRVFVSVSDNGPGISDQTMPQLFDPFFTTKQFGDGLGLGLSICYGILRSFGGTIRAENLPAPDGGACFIVELRPVDTTGTGIERRNIAAGSTAAKAGVKTPVHEFALLDDETATSFARDPTTGAGKAGPGVFRSVLRPKDKR